MQNISTPCLVLHALTVTHSSYIESQKTHHAISGLFCSESDCWNESLDRLFMPPWTSWPKLSRNCNQQAGPAVSFSGCCCIYVTCWHVHCAMYTDDSNINVWIGESVHSCLWMSISIFQPTSKFTDRSESHTDTSRRISSFSLAPSVLLNMELCWPSRDECISWKESSGRPFWSPDWILCRWSAKI